MSPIEVKDVAHPAANVSSSWTVRFAENERSGGLVMGGTFGGRALTSIDLEFIAKRVVEEFRAAPCAAVAAAIHEHGQWRYGIGAFGRLAFEERAALASSTTIFDLASVTKPVIALVMARLQRRQILHRDERLGDVVESIRGTLSEDAPLDLIAAHRAGLSGHVPLYQALVDNREFILDVAFRQAANARRVECASPIPNEGFAPVYSDMGYLLLGRALESRTKLTLDNLVEREVSAILGLRIHSAATWRQRDPAFDANVAPTEVVSWRGGLVSGAVHDENAWAFSASGVSGHAGLFGDAGSVAKLGVAIVDAIRGRSDWLRPEDVEPLIRTRQGGSLRAGFDGRSGDAPSSGTRFGRHTFGHLGFTGTSLWIDPERELVGVLLTNRVHPTRESLAIRAARPAAYDAMAEAIVSVDP